jgi:hypothetical protein
MGDVNRDDIKIKVVDHDNGSRMTEIDASLHVFSRISMIRSDAGSYKERLHDLKNMAVDQVVHACRNMDPKTLPEHEKEIILLAIQEFITSKLSFCAQQGQTFSPSDRVLNVFDFEQWVEKEYGKE